MVLIALFGCQSEELERDNSHEQDSGETVFNASFENNSVGGANTSLSGNMLWKKGDKVSLFAASTVNEQYQVSDDSDGKASATLNKVKGSSSMSGISIENNIALYPYASTVSIKKDGTNYVISKIKLPATQIYAEGSFSNEAFPMVAITSTTPDRNLKFKHILGGLKLQLKGTATIASISMIGNKNEALYGEAELTFSANSNPAINLSNITSKAVTLDCGSGVALNSETGISFIIALPPVTLSNGFTITVTDTEGKIMKISTSDSQTITRSSLLNMQEMDYVGVTNYHKEPFTLTSTGETSVAIVKNGSPEEITLEYKSGTRDWAAYTIGSAIDLSDGESLQFRAGINGNANFSKGYSDCYRVESSGSGTLKVSGNIMSLLDQNLQRTSLTDCCFMRFCASNTQLINASNLILAATSLADYCYSSMFRDCTNLITAPQLPATILTEYCYYNMFHGCTSLTIAPELPATILTEHCYLNMFTGCTGLISAPNLPATTLAMSCYSSMFKDCTSLTTAPELPATTLADHCYSSMFKGCTNLIKAPELPATTLTYSCYYEMFSGCTNLKTVPELPATTLDDNSYLFMFKGCTNLTIAPELPAKTLAFSCYQGMFYGCTNLTTAPKLPALTLAIACYKSMFYGCAMLNKAPELPATSLVSNCYDRMFSGCTNLNYIKAMFTTEPSSTYTEYWVDGVAKIGTFVKNSAATWDVSGINGIPEGWTVQTEECQ